LSSETTYPYATGDLLETRNTYFYSPYHGLAFLEAWRRQRTDALREMSDDRSPATIADAPDSPAARETDILLESIYRELTTESGALEHLSSLDRLVQRFEVSKRLHGEYNEEWRPVDATDYRSLERYVRFAEILDMAYQRIGALPYLNALLKIVDTLTALRSTLSTQQQPTLQRVITHERDHVERLTARLMGAVDAA
jgi:hypothetical protein